jgi:hypothetical protein
MFTIFPRYKAFMVFFSFAFAIDSTNHDNEMDESFVENEYFMDEILEIPMSGKADVFPETSVCFVNDRWGVQKCRLIPLIIMIFLESSLKGMRELSIFCLHIKPF